MKKLLKKLSVMRLEERVLFDAAAAVAAAEAENQAQQSEELQQQQQQLQEQLAEEAAKQQAQQQTPGTESEIPGEEDIAESEAAASQEGEGNAFEAAAGSEVAAAVEAIAADEGVEVEENTDVLEDVADENVGETVADVVDIEAGAEVDAEDDEVLSQTPAEIAASIANGTRHELVIVSDNVKDSKNIIDGLAEGTEVLVLDGEGDVLDQINEYLDKSAVKYDAIHVISHGGDGYLVLNNSVIDMESLEADPASWAAIGEHVADDGDILLYGCNVAQTENGKAFANQLASLTGADIAASFDAVGGTYGWELEYVTNAVATPVLSINGYDARLASFTVVVDGSGNYDTETYANSDTVEYRVLGGALQTRTRTDAASAWGEWSDVGVGSLSWAITQANTTEGLDIIVVQVEGNLGNGGAITEGVSITLGEANTASFGNITLTDATDGAVTISGGSAVSTGTISVTGQGTSVSIKGVSATTGTAVSTGAITLGEGTSVSFSNITAEGTGNAVNIGGAINGGNEGTSVTFSGISAEGGKAVNVTGAINAETVSFTNISTETGAYAIDLNGLTNQNGTLSNVEGNVDFGGLTVNEGTFTASSNALQVNYGNVSVNEASFTFTGAVDNLTFGSVYVNGGSFSVTNAVVSNEIAGAADVTFTGAVTVTDSTFTVAVSGNSGVIGDVKPEGSVTFNSTFTASAVKGASSVSITVTDLGEGPEYTQDDRILGNTAGTTESRIIFNGDVTLGGEGSQGRVATDFSAVYIGFNGNVAVGAGKGATTLTVSDFGQVKFAANKTFSIGASGPEAKNNDTVTFTAIDRDGFNEEHKVGYFGDKYRVEVGNLDIGRGAQLVINNLMMDVRGTTVTHYGDISGADSELTFRNTVTTLNGVGFLGGTVHLDSVRYENGLQTVDGGSIYRGHYGNLGLYLAGNGNSAQTYTIAVNLFELVGIDNITFINRNDDTAGFTGSFANVIMSGRFSEHTNVTMDFEVGSKVNVIYDSTSQQYIFGGNYYELTVTNTAEKILAGAISVGVSAEKLTALKDRYSTAYVTPTATQILTGNYPAQPADIKILARKMEHIYRGGISLGTTLKTQGNTVDFYGYTYAVTDKALIDTAGSTALSNRVSYHVAHNFVNLDQEIQGIVNLWDLLFKGQNVAHENGGVGPAGTDQATGNVRSDEANKAFFGGTYQYLTIDTMSSLPAMAGLEILRQDTITFNVDVDAAVNGAFYVTSLKEGDETSHHHLTVNVDSTMTFNNSVLRVDDASVHFNGSVLGNIAKIEANRDNTFGNSGLLETNAQASEFIGELRVTFDSNLADIGIITTDGIALLFNGDVQRVGAIDVYGNQSNAEHAKITFNGDVSILQHINTHTEYDAAKPILIFNGETTGTATVDSYRGEFYFNYDGDQEIFQGTYDDFHISGTGEKVVRGNTYIEGIFNGNETTITINAGQRFELSTLYQNAADDPHRPVFTVESGATLRFGNENTLGMDFYGSIISSGNIEFFGKGSYFGTVTLENTGNMIVDNGADGSYFAEVINKGTGLVIGREITIAELHNFGTMTVTNNNVKLDVYNHNGANLIFDLRSGTATDGEYIFEFGKGEGTVAWAENTGYAAGDEVVDGNMYVANEVVPENVRPGVEYWSKIEAFDNSSTKNYKIGDLVFSGNRVYRAVDSFVPGGSSLNNTDYWEVVGNVNAYNAGSAYDAEALVSHNGSVYVAMTAIAVGTQPGTTYWAPVANTANRLVNGGTITVNNGTLNLNNFTQGDKNAETGKWTYGGENFIVGQRGTLVLNADATDINTGNSGVPSTGAYLGSFTNDGTIKVGDIGEIAFAGSVVNNANSEFLLSNTQTTTFNGSFTHNGSLLTDNATNIIFNAGVSGEGTIGGTAGYGGTVAYNGAEQQILTGIYNNDVTLAEGVKTVIGDIVFKDDVTNNAEISGTEGSIAFNADTEGAGSFAGSLDVNYAAASSTVFAGTYGDLVINSNVRTITVDLTAANLTLSGTNTFNGADAENVSALVVNGEIILADASNTTFGEFSSLNAGSDAAAVFKGGKNGGTLTVSTNAVGSNVTVFEEGLNAAVTYNYVGADNQSIFSGTYLNGIVLGGSNKVVSNSVSVEGSNVRSWASATLTVVNGGSLSVVDGRVEIDALRVDFGGVVNLDLNGASSLGTGGDYVLTDDNTGSITSASATGVIFGGELNLSGSGTLTVYGWQDVGSLGTINVNSDSAIINFAGVPDDVDSDPADTLGYGYVNATVNNNAGPAAVVDDHGRLQNVWITITQNTFTSELTDYAVNSKFRVIDGATLTVDHFSVYNDINGNGVRDEGEAWVITNAVEAFSLLDNSTLIFDLQGGYYADGVDKVMTVKDLHVGNGSHVIFRDGTSTVEISRYAEVDGSISGDGNVYLLSGTYIGDGSFNMTGGIVGYGSDAFVYKGVYNDLKLDGNRITSAITVNGTANFSGILTGNGKVTINGETAGNGTFGDIASDKTYTGLVTYGENSGAIFGGQYNNISIVGDHAVAASLKVNLIEGGTFRLNSTLTLNDNVVLSIYGLTDANEEGNNGRIEGADSSSVIYGYNASIYGGTYGNLTADGTEYLLTKDIVVNGDAALKGTFIGDVDVTFNGDTAGTALFGAIGDDTKIFGGTVTYAATAQTVYGGNYYDLVIDGDRTLNVSLAVNNSADINGVMSGTANVIFAQGAQLLGGGSFGADGADYQGTVTYNGVDNVYGGFYTNLNFANGNTISTAVAASGNVNLAGLLNVAETGSMAFNGTTDANATGPRNTGVINAADGSTVSYGSTANVYNGTYGDLTIVGDHLLLVNGEAPAGIVVNGTATLTDGVLTGNTKVTFNGATAGNSTFGDIASNNTYTGTVTYGIAADTIYGGQYNSIIIAGTESDSHTLIASLNVTVPSGGSFNLSSELVLEDGVTLTLNGVTDANAEDNTGFITGAETSTVIYSGDASVYGGKYGNLTFTGAGYELLNNFSVANVADINGNITGSADILFNGVTTGNAVFGNIDTGVIYNGKVTFAPTAGQAQTVFSGNYSTLNITGDHELTNKLVINSAAAFEGVMSGAVDVKFEQGAVLTGSGTFGADAANRYQGVVTYNGVTGATGVFGGFYSTLILDNGNATTANINVADARLSDALNINGTGSVNFAGVTDANGSANDGSINAVAGTSVTYAETADIYGGTYGDLTVAGAHTLVSNVTVAGTADLSGDINGNADVTFAFLDGATFTGVTAFNVVAVELGGTLNVADNASLTFKGATNALTAGSTAAIKAGTNSLVNYSKDSDVFGGEYYNLQIVDSHILANSFTVAGEADLGSGTHTLSGEVSIAFNGTNAGTATLMDETEAGVALYSTVSYSATAGIVFGGSYGNLIITDAHTLTNDFVVNNSADISGVMSGTANVTFAKDAALTGAGTFGTDADNRYEGEVIYNGVDNVYGGFYSTLTFDNGNTVSVDLDAVNVKLSDVLTVANGARVNFAGTTDAFEADNDGSIDAAAGTSVTYAATANVYGGTYGDLTIIDAHELYFDITVEGLATITGEQILGDAVIVTFNGTTNADEAGAATFAEDVIPSTVIYKANAAVYGGTYGNLSIYGDHTLANTFSVAGVATFSGKQTLSGGAVVTFSGATNADAKDENDLSIATLDGTDGSVVYNGSASQGVYGGTYGELTIAGDHILNSDFSVEGEFSSGSVMSGIADVAFNGTTVGDGTTFGTDTEAYAGSVTYGTSAAAVYGGFYSTLSIIGDHTLTNDFVVNNSADISGVMSGTANVTFAKDAALTGTGTFGTDADNRYEGEVIYNGVDNVYGGFYSTLTFDNGNTVSVDLDAVNVKLSDVLTVANSARVNFAGTTDAFEADNDGSIAAAAGTSVTYAATANVYGGTYGDLTIIDAHELYFNITVEGLATITGEQILGEAVIVTFNGTTNADEAGAATFAEDVIPSTVIYKANAAVYGGTYGNLSIYGDHTLNNDFSVSGDAYIEGIMLGGAAVSFSGTNSGSGSFGSSASNRYSGVVTYNNNTVYGGFYSGTQSDAGLIITDGSVEEGVNVDAASVNLNGVLTVDGSIFFSGYTDAAAKGDAARITGSGTVSYAATADIYGGKYNNLEIYGDHYFAYSITVDGTTTIYDNADDTDASLTGAATAELTFKGAVTGNGAYFGDGTNAFAGSVIYESAEGEVLGGIYNNLTIAAERILTNSFEVTGAAVLSGTQTVADGVVIEFSGTTNADTTDARIAGNDSSTVIYNEGIALYNGTYGTLILNGAHTLTDRVINVTKAAEFNGKQTLEGTTALTLSGTNSGTGAEISGASTTLVTYDGAAGQGVFGGAYGDLTVVGAHTLANTFSVAGVATFSGKQTVSGGAVVTFSGATNADAKDENDLSIATFDGTNGSVVYNGSASQGVYGGTYGELTIAGAHALANSFSVTGMAMISGGAMSGTANVVFNGDTAGDATFGTASTSYSGDVTFGNAASVVYGGYYTNLNLLGAHNLANSFSVAGNAKITGAQTLEGGVTINFDGTNEGTGTLTDADDGIFSTVNYGADAAVIYGGAYGNLKITGARELNNNFSVAGTANFNAMLTGTANVTFKDGAVASGAGTFGSIDDGVVYSGKVTYGENVSVYNGYYSTLVLDGDRTIASRKISVSDSLSVTGEQTLSGTTLLTLSGTNSGTGTFNGGNTTEVIYNGSSAQGIIGGTYGMLTVEGAHTFNNSVVVKAAATLSGVQTINSGVTLEFRGTTNAPTGTATEGAATISGKAASTVIYGASANVYGGSYGHLTISGAHTLANEFSVSGTANITGVQTGEVKVTFNAGATITGTGSFGSSADAPYKGDVVYNSSSDVYGGYYTNLTLSGNNTIYNRNITVTGVATINGLQTLTGNTTMTFTGKNNTGNGTFNGLASSTVVYSEGAHVYGGTYWNLTINGNNTVDQDLIVNNTITLSDATVLSGSGNWVFNYTNATKTSTATIKNTGSVTYIGTGWIFGGEYKDVTINGNYSAPNVVFNGDVDGTGVITFEGTLTGTGSFQGLSAVYNQGGNIMKGTYNNLSVKGTGVIVSETVVTGALTALPTSTAGGLISGGSTSYALISGSGTLKVEGTLVNFDGSDTVSKGRFNHTGNVILAGNSYTIVGGPSGNSFGTLTVDEDVSLNLGASTVTTFDTGAGSVSNVAGVKFGTIKGAGNIKIYQDVTGSSISMEGGTVTYTADAPTTLIYGTYYNLVLGQQGEGLAVPQITIGGTVNVARNFNIGGHDLDVNSSGKLSMYTFSNNAALSNSGSVTFGSADEELGAPANRQVWSSIITNEGTITINRANYSFAGIFNEGDASAKLIVTEDVGTNSSTAIVINYFRNEFGASTSLSGITRIMEIADGGWTNEGMLSISGFENFGFAAGTALDITVANRAALNISNGGTYYFDDTNVLHLGGTINAQTGTNVVFTAVDEIVGTKTYQTTGEGAMLFAFTSPITQGLYGNLTNHGVMVFATEGQKYLGNVINGSASAETDGYFYIVADSTFKGTVNSEFGQISVGMMPDENYVEWYYSVDATFVNTVHSGSAFLIAAGSSATFENTVEAEHQFIIEGTTDVEDSLGNVTTLDGAVALFKGDVTISSGSGNDADTIFHIQEGSDVTFLSDLTNNNSGSAWHSVLMIDSTITVNGTLSNTAGSTAANVANVIVSSDGNTFGAITNTGAAAKFELNSNNNQFNGVVTNSGQLYLNGVNNFNEIKNTSPGYLWINDGASGAIFQGNITNSGTMTVASDAPENVIDLTFYGNLTNSGIVNLNAQGYTFDGAVTNSKTFNVFAAGLFDGLVTNSGTFNVAASGTSFNAVRNSGVFAINATDTVFTGRFTNSGSLNINVSDTFFYEVENSGNINLHGGFHTVMMNLIQEGGLIDIDKDSTLHLHVVTDDADSKIIVRGDRNGVFENHTTVDASDSGHGLFFENVAGLTEPQTINASIVYDTDIIEDAVWFDEAYTYLAGEEALWIVVDQAWIEANGNTLTDISLKERYRLVEGVTLTVMGTASGSRFQVKDGSTLVFANEQSLIMNGMVEVKSADAVLTLSGNTTFNGTVTNKGTVNITGASSNSFKSFNNFGTVNAFENVSGVINNNGSYVVSVSGIVFNTGFTNFGTVTVAADTTLAADIGGTVDVRSGVTLTVGVTEVSSDLLNNGTITVANEYNYLAVTGDILAGTNGTFTSAAPATLVFSGDVATGASAVFNNIVNVEYSGLAEGGQNIILGTYNNLTLNGSFKVVDDGTVTVDGVFTNNNEVKITDDGELILNGSVAGSGIYTNAGILTFSETASGAAAILNNSGVTNVNADNFTVAGGSNAGTVNVNGDNADVTAENNGSMIVNGSNAALAGQNNGSVTVNGSAATTMTDQAGASYTVNEEGVLSLGDNGGTYNASITNNGTLSVDAPVSSFAGGVTNNGVVDVNEGAALDFAALMNGNNGVVNLNDKTNLQNQSVKGNVQVNYSLNSDDLAGMTITENSTFGINADSELSAAVPNNNGTVQVGESATLTFTDAVGEVTGNYDVDGTVELQGNTEFTGSVDNSGTIQTTSTGEVTFSGATSGSGSVEGNAVYEDDATGVFGGNYGNLTVNNDASVLTDASVDTMNLNGTLATADGAAITFNGATNGNGTMAGGEGEVIYNGDASEQTIYAGQYNDITIGGNASGDFDIAGDVAIAGDAFNKSTDAEISVSEGTVTYNGVTEQHVMAGTYDELVMAGTGTKLMEAGVFNANDFVSDGGSHTGMITLKSASAPALWTLNAESSSIHYTYVDNAASTTTIYLDGTNMTGGGNTSSWYLFNGAGGIGDAYPSINNPNFQAIASYMSSLYLEWSDTDRFDAFRRMPVDIEPIAVGDMSDLVVLNNFEDYDMINFDGEFFGKEGISILDEEAGEVLNDAVSAGGSDLKALLED